LTAESFSPRCCCCCCKKFKTRGWIDWYTQQQDPRNNKLQDRLPNLPLQRKRCRDSNIILASAYSPPFRAVRAAQKIVGEAAGESGVSSAQAIIAYARICSPLEPARRPWTRIARPCRDVVVV
jgi:hypothetical protein